MGVVSSSPLKKNSILTTTPNMDARKKVLKSLGSIFSFGAKRLTTQNRIAAPPTRNAIKPNGFM